MEYLVNSREMKTCDTNTIEHFKVPSMVLMERAALSAIEVIQEKEISCNRVLVVCGTGNNGGDGMAIARLFTYRTFRLKDISMEIKHIFQSRQKNSMKSWHHMVYHLLMK